MHTLQVAALFSLTLFILGCSPSDQLTQAQFTQRFAEKLKAAAPTLSAENLSDSQLKIHGSALKDLTVNLGNAYADYQSHPNTLTEILDRMVRQTVESSQPHDAAITPENLVPLIKPLQWIENARQDALAAGATAPSLPYYETLNPQLLVLYAEYDGQRLRFVHKSDLDAASISTAELRNLARKNLLRKFPDTKALAQGNIYLLSAGGTFDVSFILMDHLFDGHTFPVNGDYVIAIPTRGTLAITGSNDHEQVKALQAMASKDFAAGPYSISPNLFIRKNGSWTVYNP